MMILSQYHIFELDTINIYSVCHQVLSNNLFLCGGHSLKLFTRLFDVWAALLLEASVSDMFYVKVVTKPPNQ